MYAEGASDVEIFTDHKNLIHFTTTKELNKRQVRWMELLGQYKFRITYTPGKDNAIADGLSRRPDLYEQKTITNSAILKFDKQRNLVPVQVNTLQLQQAELWMRKIHAAYAGDTYAQKMKSQERTVPYQYNGKIYVPDSLLTNLIEGYHDNPKHGHPGTVRTMELIGRSWSSPGLRTKVDEYIASCLSCKQNKADNHAKYRYLQKIKLPEIPWASITMDFITSLPPSQEPSIKEIYDALLVVVDRFTKYMHLVPFHSTYNATQLAYIFLDRVVRLRGFPKETITDRDKLFTSAYWKTIVGETGIKQKLSTAYHPETDGQTERTNRTVKIYLRSYVCHNQNNWVRLLPIAELSLNNLTSYATKTSLHYANYGRHLNLMDGTYENPRSDEAIKYTNDLKNLHNMIFNELEQAQIRMERYENKSRKNGPQLKEGDKVWLSTKNLKIKRPSKKLDHTKVGPFFIKAVKGPVNYELDLPKDAKVHPVFHISLLEKADDNIPVATQFAFEPEEDDVFKVEKILKKENDQYLIKWKGYPESENTWEPEHHLLPNAAALLRKFQHKEKSGTL